MRELNESEIKTVNGGYLPLISFAIAAAGNATARSLLSYALTRASFIISGLELGKSLVDSE